MWLAFASLIFYCFMLSLFDPMELPFLGNIPLFLLLLIAIVVVFVVWKLIKFAIKVFLVIVVFFIILIGLDFIGVFSWLQSIISSFL